MENQTSSQPISSPPEQKPPSPAEALRSGSTESPPSEAPGSKTSAKVGPFLSRNVIILIGVIVGVFTIVYLGIYSALNQRGGQIIKPKDQACIQVIAPARNPNTEECKDFPTPCDVPSGWMKVDSCSQDSNSMVNWKTYTNIKYNYSFKYPSEFTIEGSTPASNFVSKSPNISFKADDIGFNISINPQNSDEPNSKCMTDQECTDNFLKALGLNANNILYVEKTIFGKTRKGFEYTNSSLPICKSAQSYIFVERGYIWGVSMPNTLCISKNNKFTDETFNQILSTFQFLN